MRKPVPALAVLIALSLSGCAPEEPRVDVTDARITLPAAPGRPGAAYFTIFSTRPGRLTRVTCPQIGRIELHETMIVGDMNHMESRHDIPIAAATPVEFMPGGRHAMLYDIAPALRRGQHVTLTLTIEPLPPVTVEAEVRGPGEGFSSH